MCCLLHTGDLLKTSEALLSCRVHWGAGGEVAAVGCFLRLSKGFGLHADPMAYS